MSKKRKIVMILICLFSIYMVNMPFTKYYNAKALDLLIPNSENGIKVLELIGGDLANVVRILYVILVVLEIIAIILILRKNGEQAKRWCFFAGIFESMGALTLTSNVYLYFMRYNELMGQDVFDNSLGRGTYTMLMMGIIQILTSSGKGEGKDEEGEIQLGDSGK